MPVSNYLSYRLLPSSEFKNSEVTARRLLSQTAGLTDKLGFGDYKSEGTLPSLVDELKNPRASNELEAKIIVGQEPGGEFNYSGGGYLILQLLVDEVSGVEFTQVVTDTLLIPVGMQRSNYKFLGIQDNVSSSFLYRWCDCTNL